MFELILLITLLVLTGWSAWMDVVWLAVVAVVLYIAGNWLFGDLSHLSFLTDPMTLLSLGAFYLAVGTAWSLWKWRRWMLSDTIQSKLRNGKREHEKVDCPAPFRESTHFPVTAQPSNNVERIVTWITLWPFSMIVYFFADFLMDVGLWIYNRLGRVYSRITDAAIPDDLK